MKQTKQTTTKPVTYEKDPRKILFPSGVTATKGPRFDLIPRSALVNLANRFELGEERHSDTCWNTRCNPQALRDKEWLRARATHIIDHALKLIGKMDGVIADDGDDDAGAIAWGGICLSAAAALRKEEEEGK